MSDKTCILDEVFTFIDDHVAAERHQIITNVLYAAATHGIRRCATFPRILYTSEMESSGKTHFMMVTASLSANPMDAEGTSFALSSAMLAATNEPEKQVPSLYFDEISDIFGKSGQAGSKNPIAKYLRKGYKSGATDSMSIQRVATPYSIFTPFAMTGLRTAVPRDIRSRCLVIMCAPGKPRRYWDVRESEPYAAITQSALRSHVEVNLDTIGEFRARGIHPKLTGRKLEIWEPLFAVAYALGGQRWLNYARDAFATVGLSERDQASLSGAQTVIRDVAAIAMRLSDEPDAFILALDINDELRRIDNPLYNGLSQASVSRRMGESLPVSSHKRRVPGYDNPKHGFLRSELLAAWEAIDVDTSDDAEIQEEIDIYGDDQ